MKKLKNNIALLFFVALLAFPISAFAASYNITYEFDKFLSGPVRGFGGKNIAVYLNSKTTSPCRSCSTKFDVALYRDVWGPNDYIGSGSAPRNGSTTLKFPNVGKGEYYIELTKAGDDVTVKNADSSPKIYNY
ncbi:hypothetical protein WD019_18090 [Fictibacillus sp. Mic-4]|uniref:hypothetical protein n=1 Tax=Fictibacillus sp. Mic-4 TaxID=3132826 RepID=UPI003CE98BA2